MASISSPGIGSNLDIKTIVSQLMAVERQPLALLDVKEASYNAQLSAFGSLKGALTSLQQAAQTLNLSTTYSAVKASVADSGILDAGISGAAAAGAYDIEVKSLAQSQKLISTGYGGMDTVVGSGTIKIAFGSYSDSASPPVAFTANPDKAEQTIAIDSSNNTLQGIRDAINKAKIGVTATIINDGASYRLSLTSDETGTKNALKISVAESGAAGLSQLAYDGSAGGVSNMTQNVAAKDAVVKVDGITITKSSNTITDAIQGVTLNLRKETLSGVTTRLTIAADTSSVTSAINNFVKAYNGVNSMIASYTAYDKSSGKGSVLTGDATARTIQSQLRSVLSSALPGSPGGLSVLSDIGVSFQSDGSLTVDSTKLGKVLADPTKDISQLFSTGSNGTVGFGSRINTLVSSMIFGKDAILNGRIDGLNASIKTIDKQRDDQNARLDEVEKRYNAQFTALDAAISNMMQTSSFLTQQLSALKANTSSGN